MKGRGEYIHLHQRREGVVLLVSDVERIDNPLIKLLKSNGSKIIVSKDGLDALEKLRSLKVDLIITRLELSTMDCLEFIMNLRDLNIDSPVVIVEDNETKESSTLSIANVCAFCCAPGKKGEIIDTLTLITKMSR